VTSAEPLAISAVFPCYNDATTIGGLVEDVHGALAGITSALEVIVVNDGSADDSRHVLDSLATTRPWLRVIHHEKNTGYGGALITGFSNAKYDWIFYTDGDGQYDAKEAALLVPLAAEGVDLVQGYKIGRGDHWSRKVIGRVYHHVVKVLFRLEARDTDCDFRLFRRKLILDRPLQSTSGIICVELMRNCKEAGARLVETPVHHYFRPHGTSQFFRLPAVTRSALQLLAFWWNRVIRP
jgi:glycosyltransferase involved in cell wall biosynthesis